MVRLDRRSPENGALVSKYRLAGPQIPLVLVFAPNGAIAGGWPAVVAELKEAGVERVIMLTGDNEQTAAAIASHLGIAEWRSELLPADKVACVEALRATPSSCCARPISFPICGHHPAATSSPPQWIS